jgi:hypothetical protein
MNRMGIPLPSESILVKGIRRSFGLPGLLETMTLQVRRLGRYD